MLKTCLTCLSHENLMDLCETEWKVLEYLVSSFKNHPELKSNTNARLCMDCQGILQFVENFRISAENNFAQLMCMWDVGVTSGHFMAQCSKIVEDHNYAVQSSSAEKHTKSITVPIYYELKEPKAESCDGSEGEIISRIPDKVKVETDGDWETTASYHKVSERLDLKIEEIDAADSEETLSADELSSLLDTEKTEDPLSTITVYIPPPPSLKLPKPGFNSAKLGLKPQQPGVKPQQHGLRPLQPGLKPLQPDLKQLQPDLKLQQPDLKPRQPDLKLQQPGLNPLQPGVKPLQPDLKPLQPSLKPPESSLKQLSLQHEPSTTPATMSSTKNSKDKQYICGYCNKPFISPKAVEKHMDRSHGGSLPPVTCRICDKTVRDKYSLQVHMSSHRRKNVYCEICDRWYENSKYQLHLQISLKHHNKDDLDASFQCSVCNKRYTCKNYLESHMTYMHGKQKTGVYCRKCDKWFKPMSYKSHLKTSSNHISEDEKRYTCDHCNKKFIHYNTMKQHILCKHLNIRLFKCPHCPQEYSAKNGLVYHVRRKHERRPVTRDHVCEVCGKKFQTGSLLRKHMPVHTGERPYKCGKCDATFGHDSARYLHNRYVHEKKKCPAKKKKNTTKNMG